VTLADELAEEPVKDGCPVAEVFSKRKDRARLMTLVDDIRWASSELSSAIANVTGTKVPIVKITLHRNHKCACYETGVANG
jgi:hypothetical protein